MKISEAILSSVVMLGAGVQAEEPPAPAPESDAEIAEVTVSGTRDPALKPYRAMSAGMDAFDEFHRFAPNASLQFKLSKRGELNWYEGKWDDVNLRLVGNDTSIPVPISGDGRFSLPRSQQAYDDDADLILNQKKSFIRFSADVRTPGVPANARRLGDLRLECKVIIAIGKKELNFAQRAAFNTLFLGSDWCSAKQATVSFALPDWSMNTSLVHDGQRKHLPVYGYHVHAPIQDKSLPDDALVEFEYWSDASVERKKQFLTLWQTYLRSSADKWRPGIAFSLKENSHYSAVMSLKPGTWNFHLDSPGGEISLGAGPRDAAAALGVDHALQWRGKDLKLKVEHAGEYEFFLNLHNPDRPVIHIKRAGPAAVRISDGLQQ